MSSARRRKEGWLLGRLRPSLLVMAAFVVALAPFFTYDFQLAFRVQPNAGEPEVPSRVRVDNEPSAGEPEVSGGVRNDDEVDPAREERRCRRYGYGYDGRTERRRIFWGSLLADDSWLLLRAIAAEARGVYHTAAFVESNSTHSATPRELRFPPGSDNWEKLTKDPDLFGPTTRVTVDFYVDETDHPWNENITWINFHRQHLQRQAIIERWRRNGMRPDDIGFLSDADEVFTRDFLRAAQICDVPQFRPGQDCREAKLLCAGLVFESSPECIVKGFLLWHPDMIIGECVDLIGDEAVHRPPKREWKGTQSWRAKGHGRNGGHDYEEYLATVGVNSTDGSPMYPLWNGADFRTTAGGKQVNIRENGRMLHTGYHFHNFFESTEDIREKYATYGEKLKNARTAPLTMLHDDLSLAVSCIKGHQNLGDHKRVMTGFKGIKGPRPILFEDEELRRERHENLTRIVLEDEKVHGSALTKCRFQRCEYVNATKVTLTYA